MSAVTAAARPRRRHGHPGLRTRAVPVPALGRLLWLELRRNSMLWVLPLAAALFWFDTYRSAMTYTGPALWSMRVFFVEKGDALVDFAPFVTGAAAWAGSRESRRGTADLLAVTARPRWTRLLTTWAALAFWAAGGYLACAGVLYGVTAQQVTWGGPLWWPMAVGAVGVVAFSAAGFTIGAAFPIRIIAPLAAFAAIVVLLIGQGLTAHGGTGLVSPVQSGLNIDPAAGVFYPYLPDVSIAQVMFAGGLAAAALGVLGLPAGSGGRRVRRAAAVMTAAGLLAAVTSAALAGTARQTAHGVVIPALHDAASDRPVPYVPVCRAGGVPVCVHPAYRAYLADVTAAVRPVLAAVAGLPGAPHRVIQAATGDVNPAAEGTGGTLSGSPAVLRLPLVTLPGAFAVSRAFFAGQVRQEAAVTLMRSLIGGSPGVPGSPARGDRAQQAVATALMQAAGVTPPPAAHRPPGSWPAPGTPVYAAAQRFGALPASARRAWLAPHLAALRAGHLTLARLP